MKSQQITVRFETDVLDHVAALASRCRISRGHLIREAVRAHYGLDRPWNRDAPRVSRPEGAAHE